jgi:galactose-1-phosphate uridylyltransferase
MPIAFESTEQVARFHSPLEEFEEVEVAVDVREDPLTGRQSRIVPDNFPMPEGEPDIDDVVADDEGCFFCPGTVEEATPTYPEFVGVDRGSVGEATSFPNLNPYGTHSNVVALTEDHYVPIDEFTTDVFADGLRAAMEYVQTVFEADDDARFASVNMNFLRPAGSSIVHPHVQTLVDDRGTNEQRLRAGAARDYHEDHDAAYWHDLVAEEAGGDRHVGTTGRVDWLAPFAPKHHRHVLGVVDEADVPGPGSDALADVAEGLVNVLDAYGAAGLNSFNFAMHLVDADPAVPPVIDVVARSVFDEYYWSDSPFFVALHDEGVVDVAPEEYAAEVRERF